ncbi:hypothetical protein BZL29_5993 [Mycobacterium kansasii]|uniref:Uncharacterized protein n=1 Tax=Mycobacterium kansasii TaxID=1768 RepID=A0A1V3WSM4_MYCKA|nr:hypothetical protein BZL29_5993 [Mycobacterium kansasii]
MRDSTRATSDGSDSARKEFGYFSGLSRVNVPARPSDRRAAGTLPLSRRRRQPGQAE